jgi:hypothetical protein
MFINFFLKKVWLIIKMLFSYTAYQSENLYVFSIQRLFFKLLISLMVFNLFF